MKQVIVLESNPSDGGEYAVKAVFWFPVAANRKVPQPGVTNSAWSGASAAEVTAIQTGDVLEEVRTLRLPASFAAAEIKNALNKAWTDRKAYLDAQPFKLQYAGVFFDSVSGWSA